MGRLLLFVGLFSLNAYSTFGLSVRCNDGSVCRPDPIVALRCSNGDTCTESGSGFDCEQKGLCRKSVGLHDYNCDSGTGCDSLWRVGLVDKEEQTIAVQNQKTPQK